MSWENLQRDILEDLGEVGVSEHDRMTYERMRSRLSAQNSDSKREVEKRWDLEIRNARAREAKRIAGTSWGKLATPEAVAAARATVVQRGPTPRRAS